MGSTIALNSLVRLTRWLVLGTIFSSRWDYELAFLSWKGGRPGPRACMAHLGRVGGGVVDQASLYAAFPD